MLKTDLRKITAIKKACSTNDYPLHLPSAKKSRQLAKHLQMWTIPWEHLYFHLTGPIKNEQIITPKQQTYSAILGKQVHDFCHARKNYYYPSIERNTRDLGGYETKDGLYKTRTGMLVRTNYLGNITQDGLKQLKKMHIDQIIDLRSLNEIRHTPGLNPGENLSWKHPYQTKDGSWTICVPIFTNKQANRSRNGSFRHGMIYRYENMFVNNKHTQKAFKKLFNLFLINPATIAYGCFSGYDRTGIVSALFLSALDVNFHDIIMDYLASDFNIHNKPYIVAFNQIEGFFNSITREFGSVHNYLNYIGVSNNEIQALRNKYLVKNN